MMQCRLCGGAQGRVLYELPRPISKCESCGVVQADQSEVAGDYTESYYRGGVYADYLRDRAAIHRNASRILPELERALQGRTLLDIGCATGLFLQVARARGWTVRGLEVSQYASDYARRELGLVVDTGSITLPPSGLPKFDVITVWDTIEHLDRPDQALSNIHDLLRPGGVLALSTGDYGSLLRRLAGKKWRLFADPTHRFFFDENTLTQLLRQEKFQVLKVVRRGKWTSFSMVLHQSGLPFARRLREWVHARNWNVMLYVNLWDVMTLLARPLI